jgi:outer membrane PBP1 activator LpoA protein
LFFLAANPMQGRQLRPQLRFHDAGQIPVYAMSRIFDGSVNPASDQDLNGIYFPSTRFQLSVATGDEATELSSLRNGNFAALHALGKDAWNLLPWLPLMSKDHDLNFPGEIGQLQMSADGQLVRDPVWARFSRGRPVNVDW